MDSRRALLDAAAAEFAQHGPRGARVQAIVARAGVNERMIYHHFGSKDGLYRAVLEDQVGDMSVAWRKRLDEAVLLSPREGTRAGFMGFAAVFDDRPLLAPLLLHESMGGWQARPPMSGDQLPPQLRDLYERGVREGVFRSDIDFEVLYVTALSGLVTAPIMRGLLVDHPDGPMGIRNQVIELLLDGLTGPRPRPGEETRDEQ
jgi:TetR/AcrR family transcriptional regulator